MDARERTAHALQTLLGALAEDREGALESAKAWLADLPLGTVIKDGGSVARALIEEVAAIDGEWVEHCIGQLGMNVQEPAPQSLMLGPTAKIASCERIVSKVAVKALCIKHVRMGEPADWDAVWRDARAIYDQGVPHVKAILDEFTIPATPSE